MALYEDIFGLDTRTKWMGLVLFLWGGGVLCLAGFLANVFQGIGMHPLLEDTLRFDPFKGWWFLNLGRNLILPTEAYYHALFFATIYFVRRKNYARAFLLTAIMSYSQPFTGVELICVLLVYSVFERFANPEGKMPLIFPLAIGLLFFLHMSYYFYFLQQNPEHRLLFGQWALGWYLGFNSTS